MLLFLQMGMRCMCQKNEVIYIRSIASKWWDRIESQICLAPRVCSFYFTTWPFRGRRRKKSEDLRLNNGNTICSHIVL